MIRRLVKPGRVRTLAVVWTSAACCLVALYFHACSLGHGSAVHDWLVKPPHGHGYAERICVWRTADGGFIADYGYGQHDDRPGLLDTVETHYACVAIAGNEWRYGFYARTKMWREARVWFMRFDDRVNYPDHLSTRDAAVRWARRHIPDDPRAWAYPALPTSDIHETRLLPLGYLHNAIGLLLLAPTSLAIWLTVATMHATTRARRRSRDGRCIACNYDLRGTLDPICPECGDRSPDTAAPLPPPTLPR